MILHEIDQVRNEKREREKNNNNKKFFPTNQIRKKSQSLKLLLVYTNESDRESTE